MNRYKYKFVIQTRDNNERYMDFCAFESSLECKEYINTLKLLKIDFRVINRRIVIA